MTVAFGWPHRAEDIAFHARHGSGVVAEADGGVAGTAFCWPFRPGAATVGLVCVRPDQQGRGLGRLLMGAALDQAGERTVTLFATPAGAPLYRSLGFRDAGLVWQRQGTPGPLPPPVLPPGHDMRPLEPGDGPALAGADRAGTGMAREALLAELVAESAGAVLLHLGAPVGFGLRRRFGRGEVIGPVVLTKAAPDPAAGSRALILSLMAARTAPFVRLDVTEDSGLSPWLEQLGLDTAYEAFRMVRGAAPDGNGRSFALVSQALG